MRGREKGRQGEEQGDRQKWQNLKKKKGVEEERSTDMEDQPLECLSFSLLPIYPLPRLLFAFVLSRKPQIPFSK